MITNSLYAGNSDSFMKFSITIEDFPNRMLQMSVCLRDFSENKPTAVPFPRVHIRQASCQHERRPSASFTSLSFNFLVSKMKQVIAWEHPGALNHISNTRQGQNQ